MKDTSPGHVKISKEFKDIGISRIATIANKAHASIWVNFPDKVNPPISLLPHDGNTEIDQIPENLDYIHPNMHRQVLRTSTQNLREYREHNRRNKSAYCTGKEYYFSPVVLGTGDADLRLIVYHEVAAMMQFRHPPDKSGNYTEDEQNLIKQVLREYFPKKKRPKLTETWVKSIGFRRILYAQNHAVCDLDYSPITHYASEIFEVAFENITEQIFRRTGSIDQFEADIAQGAIDSQDIEHPRFLNKLYRVLKFVNWKIFLVAFQAGDIQKTKEYLKPYLGQYTKDWISELIVTMAEEEEIITRANSVFGMQDALKLLNLT